MGEMTGSCGIRWGWMDYQLTREVGKIGKPSILSRIVHPDCPSIL